MKEKSSFSIKEIAEWPNSRQVILPNVQRGFVWRPSQIENLWDSLLRGYPIGAFVLTPRHTDPGKYELLDGQQRATAICLGLNKETFRNTRYKIFIDLTRPPSQDSRRYYFRVITPSHPWGYERAVNSNTLSSEKKRKAMVTFKERFNIDDPFDPHTVNKVFPFDADIPVPFEMFVDSIQKNTSIIQLIDEINIWLSSRGIAKTVDNKTRGIVTEIHANLKSILKDEITYTIPVLYLNLEKFSSESDEYVVPEDENKDEDIMDPVENLFIRLNDGGTPLRGEELNYSILKSHLDLKTQELIEVSCKGFMKPARFISIAFRLFQNVNKKDQKDVLSLIIRPRSFQNSIRSRENKDAFLSFIKQILEERNFSESNLIDYTKKVLMYDKANASYGLPHVITNSIAEKAPELLLVLLYRIWKGDRFEFNSKLHKSMLGVITILMWLGKSEKQRNYNSLMLNLRPALEVLSAELFWSKIVMERAKLVDAFTLPLSILKLKELESGINKDKDILQHKSINEKEKEFIGIMFFQRDLALYAQREFLSIFIKPEHLLLDDTDVPLDWDHISPSKFIHGKRNISKVFKDWYNSNGNLRAWPYFLNRMDQDITPKEKLNPSVHEHLAFGDLRFTDLNNEFHLHLNKGNFSGKLLEWSACDEDWLHCKEYDLKEKRHWKKTYQAYMKRNFNLLRTWYNSLSIPELLLTKRSGNRFNTYLKNPFWKVLKKNDNDYLNKLEVYHDSYKTYLSQVFKIEEFNLNFFLVIDHDNEDLIKPETITFGITTAAEPHQKIRVFKIPESDRNYFTNGDKSFVESNFTLLSLQKETYDLLFQDIYNWLKEYPIKKYRELLTEEFSKIISVKFQ